MGNKLSDTQTTANPASRADKLNHTCGVVDGHARLKDCKIHVEYVRAFRLYDSLRFQASTACSLIDLYAQYADLLAALHAKGVRTLGVAVFHRGHDVCNIYIKVCPDSLKSNEVGFEKVFESPMCLYALHEGDMRHVHFACGKLHVLSYEENIPLHGDMFMIVCHDCASEIDTIEIYAPFASDNLHYSDYLREKNLLRMVSMFD